MNSTIQERTVIVPRLSTCFPESNDHVANSAQYVKVELRKSPLNYNEEIKRFVCKNL